MTLAKFKRLSKKQMREYMSQDGFFGSEEAIDFCDIALAKGVIEEVIYDPDLHGDIQDAEPDSPVYIFTV